MLVEKFKEHYGTPEYTGVVAKIQKWYYGSLVKASWCATSTSYFMNELGKSDVIGGKHENVYNLMCACEKYAKGHPEVQFFGPDEIPDKLRKDDMLFWLWSGKMCITGNKHVGHCAADCSSQSVPCIGGNQKDMICTQNYNKKFLYAVYRWNTEKKYTIGWNKDDLGWWYADTELSYYKDCWQKINRHWYYFGSDGYMLTGLQTVNGKMCYLTESGPYEGAMQITDKDGYFKEWLVDD